MDEYSILKKKPKKNAFAATSLLISIAIALLVMVGAVLVLSKVNDSDRIAASDDSTIGEKADNNSTTCEGLVKEIVFNDNLRNIKEAAINYFTNDRLPAEIGETVKITLAEMQDKKLVLNVRDASANSCDGSKSYVEVTKEENEYVMKVFLSCTDLEDYIIVHLGCYDYCDKDVCEKKEEKVYEYEYRKTSSCVMGDWSSWSSWKTTREKTSNLKKEDIKEETSIKETVDKIDATVNTSYNCNNYNGYTLVDDKCVKETTITDTKDATPSTYSYNCDKYDGYSLVGTKCVKTTVVKETIDATKDPTTYSCPSGYTKNGKKCEKSVTKTETIKATPGCDSDYTLDGTKCTKTTTKTSTKAATAVYSTKKKTEYYTCYKQECTTKTVFSCPVGGTCGNYPETSCENVKKTCSRQVDESYISGYKCDSGYTLSGTTCTKKTTITDTKDATYSCKSGYTLSGTECKRSYQDTETIDANEDPATYSCPNGYTKNGKKCTKETEETDTKDATKVDGGYICPEGYTQKDRTCTKVTVNKDTKDATKNVSYTCPSDYDKSDKTCSKKITETIKIPYYRYATRSCTGGSTSTKWSTSKNDSILKGEGYKLTGNKREVKEIIK